MKKTVKRIVSMVLVFVLTFSVLTIIPGEVLHSWYASAAEIITGSTGAEETYEAGDYTYSLINEYANVKIISYKGDDAELVIPGTIDGKVVTAIDNHAFQSKSFITSVTMPDTMETIGGYAFYDCSNLETVSFGKALKAIGGWAFYGCKKLTGVTTPATLEKIESEAFYNCTGIKTVELYGNDLSVNNWGFENISGAESIVLHEGVKTVGNNAFTSLKSLKTLTLCDSLESIGVGGFSGMGKVETVTFGKGLKTVGSSAFSNATALKTVNVNAACTSLPTNAFENDTALESIVVDNGNTAYVSYDGALMDKEMTKLLLYPKSRAGAYTIPDTVTTIAAEAFSNCVNLTEITIGDGVTSIDNNAFAECSALEKATIGDGVTSIGTSAFQNCQKLAEVVFGSSVKTIGNYAFNNDTALTSANLSDTLETIGSYAFNNCSSLETVDFGKSLKTIGAWAFYSCKKLTSVTTPATLEKIETEAFYNCTGIKTVELYGNDLSVNNWGFENISGAESIVLHEGVKTVGNNAFTSLKSLKTLTLCDSLESIGVGGFSGMGKVETVTFGKGLKTVGSSAFSNATALKMVNVNAACTSLPTNAFENDTALENIMVDNGNTAYASYNGALMNKDMTKLLLYPKSKAGAYTVPDTVTEIGAEAFSKCVNLTEITIGDGVTSIGNNAFAECSALEKATIGDGVTSIGTSAFQNCPKLAEVSFGNSVKTIGNYAFNNDTALTSANLSDTTETIGDYAFNNCSSLETVDFGKSLKTIGAWAFYGCKKLTGVTTPATLEKIETEAFYNCTGIKTIELYGNDLDIHNWGFENTSGAESIVLHDGVKSVGNNAFTNLGSLTTLTLCDSLESIGVGGFSSIGKVEDLTFGKGLKTVGTSAFSNAKALKTVNVNAACTSLPTNAFENDTALESIVVDKDNIAYASYNGALMNKDMTKILLYPKSKAGAYTVPDTVTEIGAEAFSKCVNLTEITIGDGVTSIGNNAFAECSALEKATIGNGVTTIGTSAFQNCPKLAEVVFGSSVKTIGNYAFNNDTALTSANLSDTTETIGDYAFNNCPNLETVDFGKSLKAIGAWAFYGCKKLTGVTTPATLEKIETEAFYNCTGIKTVELYGNDLDIHNWGFENISGAESIVLHEGVKSVGANVFTNTKSLKTVIIPKSLESINANAVTGYSSFTGFCYEDTPAHTYLTGLQNVTIKFIADNFFIVDLAVDKLSSGSVTLQWKKPNGYDNIDHYIIYRDGAKYSESTNTSYTDDDVTAGTAYEYEVSAVDDNGMISERRAISVTPACASVSEIALPGGKTNIGGTKPVALTATMENGLSRDGAKGEFIYSSDGEGWLLACSASADSKGTTYTGNWSLQNVESGDYTLRFRFTDKNGAVTFKDTTVSVDRTAPVKIDNVSVLPQETKISLNWVIATEHDTDKYRIYRAEGDGDFRLISEIRNRNTVHYDDVKVAKNTVYRYYIVGVDPFDQESESYDVVSACLTGDTAAPAVKRVQPAADTVISGKKTFTVTATDNVGVTKTELYCSADPEAPLEGWTLISQKNGSTFSETVDTADLPYGVIYIVAKVYDAAGNVGISDAYCYMCDNEGPDKVTNLMLAINLGSQIGLAWECPEADDTSYFIVEMKQPDGSYKQVGDPRYGKLYQIVTDLTPETEYTMRVVPYDNNKNRGTASDPITFKTQKDSLSPNVSKVVNNSNTYGYAADNIEFTITAVDDYQLATVELQSSTDKKNWTTVKSFNAEHNKKEQTFNYTLDVSAMNEGELYIRVVAKDTAGNSSIDKDTDILTYHVDRTPSAVPANVTASSDTDYAVISWSAPDDESVVGFNLMRSDKKDGDYKQIRTKTNSIVVYDEDVTPGKTYWYKVQSVDKAGNLSGFSAPVSCTVTPDTKAPWLNGYAPGNNAKLSPEYPTVNIEVIDNSVLSSLKVEYKVNALFSVYSVIREINDNTSKKCNVYINIPIASLSDGDQISLLINATDAAGNAMEPKELTYTIDKEAPELKNVKVTNAGEKNIVNWESTSTDTTKFYVLRQTTEGGEFTAIKAVERENGKTSYGFADENLGKNTYFKYRVAAYDDVMNHREADTEAITIPKPSWVRAHLSYDSYQVEGKEYLYDMSGSESASSVVKYRFDFGDGTSATETTNPKQWHLYEHEGSYEVTATAYDEDGNTSQSKGTVTVEPARITGHVTVCVQDESGKNVGGAEVYLDGDTSRAHYTNASGFTEFDLPLGTHTFAAFKNGYSPMSGQTVSVNGGDQTVYVPIRNKELVTCDFTVKKMTFEEIKEAGIDLESDENYRSGVLKFDVKFVSENVPVTGTYYYGGGRLIGDPIHITVGQNTSTPIKRILTPMIIGVDDKDNPLLAFLDIPDMEYTALKDFFDVNLTVYNNASRDYNLTGCQVTLNTPGGLGLVTDSSESNVSLARTVSLGTIPGGGNASARWILRGDEAGEYDLSADFTGTLSYFNRPISAHFAYDGTITVSKTPLAAELQISNTVNSKGQVFYNLVIENTGTGPVMLPLGAMNFKESFCDELIMPDGSDFEIAKRGTNIIDEGVKLVYHFRSQESVLKEFKTSIMETFAAADVDLKITYHDDGMFRERYDRKFPKEDYVFRVTDSKDKPIEGAKINIGTKDSFVTDANGQVTLSGSIAEETDAKFLEVSCAGYITHKDEDFKGTLYGSGKNIKLYRAGEFALASVSMDGTDVLTNSVNLYVDDINSDYTSARVTFIVRLAGQQAKELHFVQNGSSVVAPVSENYNKGDNKYTFTTYVSRFKENTPITLKVTAESGKTISKELMVAPMKGRYNYDFSVPGVSGIDLSSTGLEFLSEVNLDFPISNIANFSYSYNREEDSHTIAVSTHPWDIQKEIGSKAASNPSLDSIWNDFKESLKNYLENDDYATSSHTFSANAAVGFAVSYKFVNGTPEITGAKAFVILSAGYQYETLIPAAFLPIPLTLGIGVSGTLQGEMGVEQADNGSYTPNGTVTGEIGFTPSLAVGVPMLNVGFYATLKLTATEKITPQEAYWDKVTLGGEFGITYSITIFSGNIPLVSGDIWKIYDHDEEEKKKKESGVGAMFDEASYSVNKKLLGYDAKWSRPVIIGSGTSTLMDNVDNAEKPQLAKVGDKTVMVYRAVDKQATSAANSPAIYYSVFDPATLSWSTPVKLDQNHCSDVDFKLSSDGVTAQVVYSQVNGELNDDVTMSDFFKKTDIYASSFNPNTDSFEAPVKVSDNSVGDADPIVKYIGSTPTAVWVENSSNNIFLNDNSNKLMMSRCVNGVWTEPVAIGSGMSNLLDFDIVENGKTQSVVYVTDTDGDLTTTDDRPMYMYNFVSDEQQLVCEDASAGFTTCMFRGRSSVLWQNSGTMMCYDVASGKSIALCNNFFGSVHDVQLLDNDGTYELVYNDGYKSVCMMTYNSVTNRWSKPVTLIESEDYLQNVTAAYVNGKLTLTYHETKVLDKNYNTQSALKQTVIENQPKLTIDDVEVSYTAVKAGAETTVYADVTNNGIRPTGDLVFAVTNYDGKSLGTVTVEDSSVGVGETKTVPVTFTAPENIVDRELTLSVSDELSDASGSRAFNLGCSDVQVRATEYVDGTTPYIRAVVSNNTDYDTPARLEVYNYTTGEVYYTRNIPNVSSERSLTYDIPLEESYANEKGIVAVRVVPTANDARESNNCDLFGYFDPATVIGDANLDGKLTIDDVTLIQKHLAGYMPPLQGKALRNCDTNKDGKVDISDATRIQLYLSRFSNVNMGYCGLNM